MKDLRYIIWCQTGWCWYWYTAGGGGLANITVDANGGITGVTIVHGGGAYASETLCKLLVSPHPQDTLLVF